MPKKFDPKEKDRLLSSDRRNHLDTHSVLSMLPLHPYQDVADVGCGPGYFTLPLAKHLFDGKVYAIDIQQEMLDAVKERIDKVHLTNVDLVRSEENKLKIDKESVDGALVAFAVHEANNPATFLRQVARSLRKGGWAAILEWHRKEEEDGPPVEERIEESDLKKIVGKAGLRLTNRHNLNASQYMLVMRK
jgi:ubiquinone/menaquinone biosynthesis C-methylase UbiE